MTKIKTILLTVMLTLGLTGCGSKGSSSPTPHTHEYDEGVVTKEATCTEDGIKTFTCECGYTYTEVIPATGHNFSEWVVTIPATCGEAGEETRTCACGETETRSIPATGEHSYDDGVVTEATATQDAFTTFTCQTCGHTNVVIDEGTHTGDAIPVGLAYMSSALLTELTGQAVYTPDYMFANMVKYDTTDGVYWFAVSFGTSVDTDTLQSFVSAILDDYGYFALQGMTAAEGNYYGFYLDTEVEDIYEDTIVYEVDCYVNSKGATALQVVAAYAPYFMSEE